MTLKFLLCVFVILIAVSQIDCQETTSITSSISNNLSEIFNNIYEVKWRSLTALGGILMNLSGIGTQLVARSTKGLADGINRGSAVFDLGKTGAGYLSSGLNTVGDTIESYAGYLLGAVTPSS